MKKSDLDEWVKYCGPFRTHWWGRLSLPNTSGVLVLADVKYRAILVTETTDPRLTTKHALRDARKTNLFDGIIPHYVWLVVPLSTNLTLARTAELLSVQLNPSYGIASPVE